MSEESPRDFNLNCPIPTGKHQTVQMAHGGGGRVMRQLIEEMFLPAFRDEGQQTPPHDSAIINIDANRLAMTTDSFVVTPLFFPGGDIGKLAIYGTVNDLAMAGAKPVCLSVGVILEEGLEIKTLQRIVDSMKEAAREVGVRIVTGDTKVVDKGKGDGIYINTTGIGVVPTEVNISPTRVTPGDAIIVSGDLGRHGMAIMSLREGMRFDCQFESDCASLVGLVDAMTATGADVHCLRDLTRGGLAAALNEIALDVGLGMSLRETDIPVSPPVSAACELLGLDPLYVANEGCLVAFVPPAAADSVLETMRLHQKTTTPTIIGTVTDSHPGTVLLNGPFGGERILDLLSGEQMPRIC